MANVDGAHITEGYRWYTAVGARLSFVDDGLTFGTNCERGVCIHFAEPVRSCHRHEAALGAHRHRRRLRRGWSNAIGADEPRSSG